MLEWLTDIFNNANTTTQEGTLQINAMQVEAFGTELNSGRNPLLRIFAATGGGWGNQSSTVNVLRRIVDPLSEDNLTFNYSGTIDVYYDGGKETLDKLFDLLPEMNKTTSGKIRNADVNLIAFDDKNPPKDAVNFGLTGAIDSNTTDLAAALNVKYFIQLQPYNYTRNNILWFNDGREKVNLDEVPALNNPGFNQRVFFVPPSTYNNPDWDKYNTDAAKVLKYLTGEDILKEVRLVVSYIIMPGNENVINSSPEAAAAILNGSLLQWQEKGQYRLAAPVVLINTKPWGTPDDDSGLQKTEGLLEGTMTPTEAIMIANGSQKTQRAFEARAKYMKSLDAQNRWNYLNYPNLSDTKTAVGNIIRKENQVLFIQLGPLPQPLYYYALAKTNMFSIFEGNNSVMAGINMGKPFLNAPRMGNRLDSALYPNINRGFFSASPPVTALASAANQLNFSLDNWPTSNSQNPCVRMGSFLQTLTDQVSVSGPIPKYFTDIKDFYAASDQDKMNVALAYMMNIFQQDNPGGMAVARFTAVLLEEDDNPLNALYKELQEKVVIGEKLDLVPGVIAGGNINTILLNLLKGFSLTLWLLVETFTREGSDDDVKEITLTGTTGVFKDLNVTNTIAVIFDAPDNQLRTAVKFGTLDPDKKEDFWSIPGAPWIQMWNPFLKITVSDGQIPVTAEMGGTYKPINANLKVLLPVAQDQWLTTVSFSKDFPGIGTIFQMAASVNLVQLMPPPINTLVDLGLKQVDFYYDYKKKTVPALGFIIANNSSEPLPLIGPVSLGAIEVQVALTEPLTKRETQVSATAKFTIGTGEDAGVIAVNVQYPNWQFQGGLESGVIKFADILSMFLPGVSLDLPQLPTITEFNFSYLKESELMTITMRLNIQWDFNFFGKNLFSIEDVGFSVSREKVKNTGNVTGNVALFKGSGSEVDLNIGAYYLGDSNWQFIAKQTGGVFSIVDLMKYYLGWEVPDIFPKVDGLSLTLDWGKKGSTSFEFTAKTAERWYPLGKDQFPDVWATGSLMMGCSGKEGTGTGMELVALDDNKPVGSYGKLSATVNLWNINVEMSYNYDPEVNNLCITWLFITGCIGTSKEGDTIATFKLNGKSIGEMVEMFVSWATGAEFGLAAPWSVLNSFTLNAFEVIYNFTKKKVSFKINIGPIDFGLFKINGVSLTYNPDEKQNPVEITIDGSFVWQSGESLSWDPSKPECTPAPPGGGNKYLDLRLLALGQHVTVDRLTEQRNVQGVIEMLRKLKIPNPPEIPVGGEGQPIPAPGNSWFVAFDFGVLKVEKKGGSGGGKMLPAAAVGSDLPTSLADEEAAEYFIQLSLVFNDPILYALRIALAGPMAKIFKGLDFQIMYRQVSETVGCYSAQIALPDIMRKFQIGVATITLPNFAIDVYTNGDFQVDIGFPWNEDFARSFTIEVIVAPGIPILGSAGFYFGKLSSATTDKVPKATNGWFNPVLVFGFGAQLGLGKSIELGILKAGFSLTIFGIIEGVLARFLPYKEPTKEGLPMELQDGYYFSLTGTVGVQGRLYGTIDFAIIKADVNIEIKLFLMITFVAYEDIPITAQASVRVSVKVSINLGLFKISITLSFSATVKATFVLNNPLGGKPPWITEGISASARALQMRRMRRALNFFAALPDDVSPKTFNPTWSNLQPGPVLNMEGYLAPVLSVAGDEASQPTDQEVIYVANFFLKTPAPVQKANPKTSAQKRQAADGSARVVEEENVAHEALARANERLAAKRAMAADSSKNTFEDLAIRILQWVIAAGMDKMTPDQVDQQVVTHDYLTSAMNYLSTSTSIPIPSDDVNSFLNQQTSFLFTMPTDEGEANAVFFPAPPGATLDVSDYGDWKGFKYSFGDYNSSSAKYLQDLNDYFKQLKVQVQQQEEGSQAKTMAAAGSGTSIADFVFGDYFALVATQGLQALIDGLDNFKWVIDETKTVGDIVKWVNDTGELSGDDIFTAGILFTANRDHILKVDRTLTISGMTWTSPGGASFTDIAAQEQFKNRFDAATLATLNAANARILAANVTVKYEGKVYITDSGDSLDTIATFFKIDIATLLKDTDVLKDQTLIQALAIVTIPDFSYTTVKDDKLSSIAGQFGVAPDLLADANRDKKDIFDKTGDPNLNLPQLARFNVGQLINEAERTLGLQNLGAMASRYYLHGLRLPTDGLTANARGLFVKEIVKPDPEPPEYKYPEQLGLFALTGQAFPLPDIKDPTNKSDDDPKFSFTITRGSETWYSLGSPGSASETFTLKDQNDYLRYRNVWKFAKGKILETGTRTVAALAAAEAQPSQFPLSQEISWQTTVAVTLPHQKVTPKNPQPRLWTFPDSLVNTPHENGVLPLMKAVLAQTDEATGTTKDAAVDNYGFGTLINFTIKTTQPVVGSPTTGKLYEIIAASTKDIVLLERLLNQLQGNDSSFQQLVLLYPPSTSSSDVKGWQMDDPRTSLMGISQVNLSTETRPPTGAGLTAARLANDDEFANLINPPTQFLRLLWEATITRQGGFYLSYFTGIGGVVKGLPDHIFNDHSEADIAVMALFKAEEKDGQHVTNFMNIAATNQPLDLDDAALIAQVVPVITTSDKTDVTVKSSDTLAEIAGLFYMDPGLLVSMNATITLKVRVTILVAGGTYEVPPLGGSRPGGVLKDIADYFNTTPEAIKAANPFRIGWPDPLPLYTGLKLPDVEIEIGTSYFGSKVFKSFGDLASYYNAPMAELAAANQGKSGLFNDGTVFNLAIGPNSLSPVLPAGVAGIDLTRSAPADLPKLPTDPGWGNIYLLHLFNLLGYRIAENPDFKESFWGLPAGPSYDDGSTPVDKIQAARALEEGDEWVYTQAVPYPTLYAHKSTSSADSTLPPVQDSPYWGVGGLLQLELEWLDIFGNEILSDFNAPQAGSSTPLNFSPQLTGYTDRLLGVGQWPAVANAYRFLPDAEKKPGLEMMLAFDKSRYEEAASALARGEEDKKLKLEQALMAYQQIWYQLNDPNGVTVSLTSTVTPGVESLISADQVKALIAWVESIYNYLQSLLPGAPDRLKQAAADFDPEFSLTVSVDASKLNSDEIFKVSTYLNFTRSASLVDGELTTSAGVTEVSTNLAPWTGSLTENEVNTETHKRFMAAAGRSAVYAESDTTEQRELNAFAAAFKNAFSSVNGVAMEITTSADRNVFSGSSTGSVWAVQLGSKDTENDISYKIENEGDPRLYAPRPISNKLESRQKTPIIPYETGKVIGLEDTPKDKAFISVDLDQWLRFTLAQVDELLSPKFIAPAQILREKTGIDTMQKVLDAKKDLAEGLKTTMIPVFENGSADEQEKEAIRETFFQTMLGTLSNFYSVKAGIQFKADVNAAIARQEDAEEPPRLFGDIVMQEPEMQGPDTLKNISLSSPKLQLKFKDQSDDPRFLSFLLSSTAIIAKKVDLKLEYNGQYIEHQIGALKGIRGYKPSSWLSFANDTQVETWPLNKSLGEFEVPIVLREFPETPTLVVQDFITGLSSPCYTPPEPVPNTMAGNDDDCPRPGTYNPLTDIALWDYGFTYSQQVHYLQNAIHGEIRFNVRIETNANFKLANERDLFDNLAEFTQEYPKILSDLKKFLATMDVDSSDPTQIRNAQAALESAARITQWVADSAKSSTTVQLRPMFLKTSALPAYEFTLTEDEVQKTNPGGGTVMALEVTVKLEQNPPERVGTPLVRIEPEVYECEPDAGNGDKTYKFCYKSKKTGDYLEAETAMTIAERQFILPNMGVLERQDAEASIFLTRNEELIDGKPTAKPFIYTTPTVYFPDPLLPTIRVDTPINLAAIDARSKDEPVIRSLTCQLTVFYKALFENAGTDNVSIEMTSHYEYAISTQVQKIQLPVQMMPPTNTDLTGSASGGKTLDEVIANQVEGIDTWFKTHKPEETDGTLIFNMTIMSTLTGNPMPLLKLTDLYVELDNLEPKPGK